MSISKRALISFSQGIFNSHIGNAQSQEAIESKHLLNIKNPRSGTE